MIKVYISLLDNFMLTSLKNNFLVKYKLTMWKSHKPGVHKLSTKLGAT